MGLSRLLALGLGKIEVILFDKVHRRQLSICKKANILEMLAFLHVLK